MKKVGGEGGVGHLRPQSMWVPVHGKMIYIYTYTYIYIYIYKKPQYGIQNIGCLLVRSEERDQTGSKIREFSTLPENFQLSRSCKCQNLLLPSSALGPKKVWQAPSYHWTTMILVTKPQADFPIDTGVTSLLTILVMRIALKKIHHICCCSVCKSCPAL